MSTMKPSQLYHPAAPFNPFLLLRTPDSAHDTEEPISVPMINIVYLDPGLVIIDYERVAELRSPHNQSHVRGRMPYHGMLRPEFYIVSIYIVTPTSSTAYAWRCLSALGAGTPSPSHIPFHHHALHIIISYNNSNTVVQTNQYRYDGIDRSWRR